MNERENAAAVGVQMQNMIEREVSWVDGNYRDDAARIIATLRETDPGFLTAWLDAQVDHLVWQAICDRDRLTRWAREGTPRSVFNVITQAWEDGDPAAVTGWLDRVRCRREARVSAVANGLRRLGEGVR